MRMQKRSKAQWKSLLRKIPGYDPFAAPGNTVFDQDVADHALRFFAEALYHPKAVQGCPPFVLERWQQAIIANLFGWRHADGRRRYREGLLYVPRKNGKSPLGAGIVLYVMCNDLEPGMECYSAAADRDQASIVFNYASGMIQLNEDLSSRLRIYRALKSIEHQKNGAVYRVLSHDANTKHGFNTHLAIIDETHAHPSRDLIDVMTTSTGARRNPLIMHMTTSDYERPSICNEKYEYACKVRDGVIENPAFLPVVYEAPQTCLEDNSWKTSKVWRMANPNYDISIRADYLKSECQRAIETPAYQATFQRLHLNLKTQAQQVWLSLDSWRNSTGEVNAAALLGRPCWGGLDLSSTADLTSLCLVFPPDENEAYQALWWHWVPEDGAVKRERRDGVPYIAWERQGHIDFTDGNEIDYQHVRADINRIGEQYLIQDIGVDRLFQGAAICQDLARDGFTIFEFGQGFLSMAAPCREFERLVNAGKFHHGGNPIATWAISHCMVKQDDAGNMKPSKSKSTEKIDTIVSALMALGRALVSDAKPKGSVYDSRGVMIL